MRGVGDGRRKERDGEENKRGESLTVGSEGTDNKCPCSCTTGTDQISVPTRWQSVTPRK